MIYNLAFTEILQTMTATIETQVSWFELTLLN